MAFTNNLPEFFPLMYKAGWIQALQQKSARSRPYVNIVPMNGRLELFGKIGKSVATKITTRFGETNPDELVTDQRALKVGFSKIAKRIDRREMLQMVDRGTLQGAGITSMIHAAHRDFDATLVAGINGPAFEGEFGDTSVPFPAGQEIAVNYVNTGSPTNTGATFDKVLRIKEMMGEANVSGQDVEGNSNIVWLITHRQLTDLLNIDKFTNGFYQNIKPLAGPGEIYTLMGITIVVLDPLLLPIDAGTDIRTTLVYAKDYVMFGVAEDITTEVDRLIDGNYDWQLYAEWGWGATRIFDEAVIRVYADESP